MIGRIARLVGYTKAPTATYLLRHPVEGAKALQASRQGLNRAAVTGVGAAVLALPISVWLLRRRWAAGKVAGDSQQKR